MGRMSLVLSKAGVIVVFSCALLCLCGCNEPPGPESKPNLIISYTNLDPPKFTEGDQVTFTYTIKNAGNAKAEPRPAWNVGASDQGTVHVAPGAPGTSLEPGATTSSIHKYVWNPMCNTKIKIQVDPNNAIDESNELDNTWEMTLDHNVCEENPMLDPAVTAFYQDCVDRINKLRALESLPPLVRDQGHEACSNSDAKVNFEKGIPHFQKCSQVQNECPALPSISQVLNDCIQTQMYYQEKANYKTNPNGCYNAPWPDTCGHYVNITDKNNEGYKKVACGIYATPSGGFLAIMNFFE
jgi:uncharacterized repeat protein (TIGR01451 family)